MNNLFLFGNPDIMITKVANFVHDMDIRIKTRNGENFKSCPDGVIDCHLNEDGTYEQVGDKK